MEYQRRMEITWRIIPLGNQIAPMVNKSPNRVLPFITNGYKWSIGSTSADTRSDGDMGKYITQTIDFCGGYPLMGQ